MSDLGEYNPPNKWVWDKENGGKFANINRPISGSTHQKELPLGKHPFQLYSQGTPNGIKVTIMLEELLELGIKEAEYDAWLIRIGKGDQFSSGFVEINRNSKIPCFVDNSGNKSIKVFESGSILLYLADKFQNFIPKAFDQRTECLNWLFWQMASAPYLGGGFGHFYAYAPEKFEYPIDRFSMEVKRQLDVLDKLLSDRTYICNEQYTIADIAIWSWYGALVLGRLYGAEEFLDVKSYKNVVEWANLINERPAVKRGRIVNKISGNVDEQLHERHDSSDFNKKTEDKLVD
ncbi:glutathione-dependent disulfide-bond oxidoreductase [Alphaproteobacteria bacterium]|nr:glutathione-dependent disulfide-bond oxidoreductase [Alphaproteobacteria bacterium]MDC1087429.1 glutathione-dependent disulfide-bond oxidoreductase [Alphaproteobacteria bacterium]